MEMDVNRPTGRHGNLMTISARCSNNNAAEAGAGVGATRTPAAGSEAPPSGCCGILGRLLCVSRHKATQSVAGSDPFSQLQLQRKGVATPAAVSGQRRRRTPQEIYFESRGKSCKKLLKFNGNSNKVSGEGQGHLNGYIRTKDTEIRRDAHQILAREAAAFSGFN